MMQTINPVSHIERWGFVILMKLPAAPFAGFPFHSNNLWGIPAKVNKEILKGCCCL